jgi:hypothetical protein
MRWRLGWCNSGAARKLLQPRLWRFERRGCGLAAAFPNVVALAARSELEHSLLPMKVTSAQLESMAAT